MKLGSSVSRGHKLAISHLTFLIGLPKAYLKDKNNKILPC